MVYYRNPNKSVMACGRSTPLLLLFFFLQSVFIIQAAASEAANNRAVKAKESDCQISEHLTE